MSNTTYTLTTVRGYNTMRGWTEETKEIRFSISGDMARVVLEIKREGQRIAQPIKGNMPRSEARKLASDAIARADRHEWR